MHTPKSYHRRAEVRRWRRNRRAAYLRKAGLSWEAVARRMTRGDVTEAKRMVQAVEPQAPPRASEEASDASE